MIVESEMISPQGYIQQHKDKPLEELIKERNKLLDRIGEYEETYILNKKTPEFTSIIIEPSPYTVYFWDNRYLNELTDLIIERKKESKVKTSIDTIIEKSKNTTDITSGVLGFVIGDCLGVPVEFKNRYWLKSNPVKDMLEKGSHFQPKGTWSDDTSMVLATMHSLIELKGYKNKSFYDMADKFVAWYKNGLYSPNGEAFDVGNTTRKALEKFIANRNKECGEGSLYDNGNGSLMRVLPLAYYFDKTNTNLNERKNITFEVSSITHSHIMSKYACLMYVEFLLNILRGIDKYQSYGMMIERIEELLKSEEKEDKKIIKEAYKRILNGKIDTLKEKDIKSSGYVVDTLEAVLWIVLNSKEYKESVLEAVNLGDDTDTVGALAGGLLGAIYGIESIPTEWIECVIRKDEILNECRNWETIQFNAVNVYITMGGEILDNKNISDKYEILYEILDKYKDYHKNLDLTKTKNVDEKGFQIIKELMEEKILCRNYDEITTVTIYELLKSNNKREDINKLNILECLALITVIQRESYWDGGYTEVFYKYTENEILPLLVNRILDIIYDKIIVGILIAYLFYYALVKIENPQIKDSLKILEADEMRYPEFVFKKDCMQGILFASIEKLSDTEYEMVKKQAVEILNNYIKNPKHKELDIICSDESLGELVDEIISLNNKESSDEKINREVLIEKLQKNYNISENIYVNIISGLNIIEDEIQKKKPIENDETVLGIRQKFVVEEFDKYITSKEKMYVENKYYQTYYDIEQFIEGAEYPADRYQNPEFKYSKYMSSKEVKILTDMINRLKSECQKELDQQSTSLDKEVVLKIRHTNWGMIGPNDWTDVIWKIYNDLTVDIEKSYNRVEQNIETTSKKITKKDYDNILKNIELSKENSVVVEACDGSAWEMTQYEKGQEVWKKELGYIYGIKPLEEIAKIVMKLV